MGRAVGLQEPVVVVVDRRGLSVSRLVIQRGSCTPGQLARVIIVGLRRYCRQERRLRLVVLYR